MKKRIIIPTVLVGVLGGVALTQSQIFSSAEGNTLLSATEAKQIALKEYDGNVIEFDFDRDGAPHYEFEIIKGNEKAEIVVDAQSGAVLITELEAINVKGLAKVGNSIDMAVANAQVKAEDVVLKVAPGLTASAASVISSDEAIAIALKEARGTVVDVDFDDDDLEYAIEIRDGQVEYDVEIDGKTGTVLIVEQN